MNKKLLLGVGLATAIVAGVSYFTTKPYFEEKARIEMLADQLESRNKTRFGGGVHWRYRYDFDIPDNPKVADWNIENVTLPQVLFTVANPEDESKVSYWALNIDGTNLQLLISEGVLPPPPQYGTVDYGIYMSRSPNGRYLIVPQQTGTVLYDLEDGEATKLGEVSTSVHDVMWSMDSSQVVVKRKNELTKVMLPSKEITQFTDVNGPLANVVLTFSKAYMDQNHDDVFLHLENEDGGGWLYCADESDLKEYQESFGDKLNKCGNTLVVDANTLKVIDRGDYTPRNGNCNVRGSKFADGFYCLGHGGGVYKSGKPSQKVAQYHTRGFMLALNGGDMWFTSEKQRNISRVLNQPNESSPTRQMFYTFRGLKDGNRVEMSGFGFGFSRYVIENKDTNIWSDSLFPLPNYRDIDKAKLVLEERKNG
ncbi:hypothetical protein [Vibrio sp. St2]|uniref:hypothetical protein n=1 Tax=Vibrio sp. St2 TaxID=2853441 RepID=UPI00248E84EF|nr:hypothetical protein [Vibrio sp. St2]